MKLRFSQRAANDLRAIHSFIAESNPANARRWLTRLRQVCDLLCDSPRMGKQRDEFAPGLRTVVHKGYVIIYRISNAAVEVVRVTEGSQNYEEWNPEDF